MMYRESGYRFRLIFIQLLERENKFVERERQLGSAETEWEPQLDEQKNIPFACFNYISPTLTNYVYQFREKIFIEGIIYFIYIFINIFIYENEIQLLCSSSI